MDDLIFILSSCSLVMFTAGAIFEGKKEVITVPDLFESLGLVWFLSAYLFMILKMFLKNDYRKEQAEMIEKYKES